MDLLLPFQHFFVLFIRNLRGFLSFVLVLVSRIQNLSRLIWKHAKKQIPNTPQMKVVGQHGRNQSGTKQKKKNSELSPVTLRLFKVTHHFPSLLNLNCAWRLTSETAFIKLVKAYSHSWLVFVYRKYSSSEACQGELTACYFTCFLQKGERKIVAAGCSMTLGLITLNTISLCTLQRHW